MPNWVHKRKGCIRVFKLLIPTSPTPRILPLSTYSFSFYCSNVPQTLSPLFFSMSQPDVPMLVPPPQGDPQQKWPINPRLLAVPYYANSYIDPRAHALAYVERGLYDEALTALKDTGITFYADSSGKSTYIFVGNKN
jgi:hypothetical protein